MNGNRLRIPIEDMSDIEKLALILAIMNDDGDVLTKDTEFKDLHIKPNVGAPPDMRVITTTDGAIHYTQLPVKDCCVLSQALLGIKNQKVIVIEIEMLPHVPGGDNTTRIEEHRMTEEEFAAYMADEEDPVAPMD